MQKVYLETSVISYLTARPSRELLIAANQEHTRRWWDEHRHAFEPFVSERVIDEISAGDPEQARKRLAAVEGILSLPITEKIDVLAAELLRRAGLPMSAEDDAVHIAAAAVHGMHFLLTWNCRHIANPRVMEKARLVCDSRNLLCPTICTPHELVSYYVNEEPEMKEEDDPILAEIRRFRDARAARFNYDLHAMCEDSRKHEEKLKAEGWNFVSGKPRKHPLFNGDPEVELQKLVTQDRAEREAARANGGR